MNFATLRPHRLLSRIRYLRECLSHQQAVEEYLKDHEFFVQCAAQREELRAAFRNRLQLQSLQVDEGTMLFPIELRLLQELVERSNALPGPIIEVGTLFGYTTSRLALWKAADKKVITVDNYSWNPWNVSSDVHQSLTRRFLHYLDASGQVEIRCMDKNDFFASYRGEPPALVFIDADHSYEATKADIVWAHHIGAAIIAGHDYASHCPGVGRAVDDMGGAARHAGGVWALNTGYWKSQFQRKAA